MSDHAFGAIDIGLAFALVLGLAIWQLVAVRRSIGRDRKGTETTKGPEP